VGFHPLHQRRLTHPQYTYTGKYTYTSDFGLMYYGARWYDLQVGIVRKVKVL